MLSLFNFKIKLYSVDRVKQLAAIYMFFSLLYAKT